MQNYASRLYTHNRICILGANSIYLWILITKNVYCLQAPNKDKAPPPSKWSKGKKQKEKVNNAVNEFLTPTITDRIVSCTRQLSIAHR
jgi:hypothetical protein